MFSARHILFYNIFQLAVVQVNQNFLSVLNLPKIHSYEVKLQIQPKGLCSAQQFLAAWDGKTVTVLEMTDSGSSLTTGLLIYVYITQGSHQITGFCRFPGTFQSTTSTAVIYGQGIYVAEPGKVQARTFQVRMKYLSSQPAMKFEATCREQ